MAEAPRKPPCGRTLSCQGVSFDPVSRLAHFPPLQPAEEAGDSSGRRVWMPWVRNVSFSKLPGSQHITRSTSKTSSHFCDLDNSDEDDIEEQKLPAIELRPPTATESSNYRLTMILLDQVQGGQLTVYKRLFAVVFTLNITLIGLSIAGHLPSVEESAALIAIANILVLTLCRSEAFLRVVFWLAVKGLGWPIVPLPLKLAATSFLQSIGGIHSSCGVSSVAWLIYALVLTLKGESTTEIVAIASIILSLLCLSCLAAFPLLRHLHHNVFELTHRFTGWGALVLLWVFVVLTTGYNPETKSYDDFGNSNLVKKLQLWFTVAISFFTILPWVTVRRVPVSVSNPSRHASLLKFNGGVAVGLLGRISRSPLSDWHAFGIISDGEDSHMMLVGAVGDFTRGLVSDPPTHLWVRGLQFAGLPYLVNIYNRVVLVATGSGICVFLSFLLQPCAADVCVLWVAKGVEQNFGKEIETIMSTNPPGKVIVHDTAVSGRPNIAEMTVAAVKKWKAEVVVVTSNPQGSKDVVLACKDVGIPAFGPIWDS